jgi:DHA2 family multidrug resistance protein-like MFS transporter
MSPVFTLTTDVIVGSAPAERAGAASAVSETSAEFGGALGIAIFGSVGVAVYRAAELPAGVPAATAAASRATLAGAVAAARELPEPVGIALLDATRAAFLGGLHVCAAVSCAGAIALALFTIATLRRARSAAPLG